MARALRERFPEIRLLGLGGPRMESEGVELLAGLDDLAVMGFVEVAARFFFFWKLERRVNSLLDRGGIDLVLPVDYPGFNLRLARSASDRGIPVLYYIAPQVWAWKKGRARKLAAWASRIAVILPFEEAIFRDAGGNARFVGHPLLDRTETAQDPESFFSTSGLDPDRPLLALFPGSRRQELDRHLDVFLEAGREVQRRRPDTQLALARAASAPAAWYDGIDVPVTVEGRALLRHARAALVKSGTSTLEAALEETPFVTAYRTSPVTYALARHLVSVENIALANLVAGRKVVPEVIQGRATPGHLADLLVPLLDTGSPERKRMVEDLRGVRRSLGEPGAAGRVADLAASLLRATSREERA